MRGAPERLARNGTRPGGGRAVGHANSPKSARGGSGPAGPPRGGHVVDLALLFAELARAPGVTQADLGRRYRKSAGYVSVVCRLGRALHDVPPEARDDLRVPHFTLKAAQALVSRHPDPAALRAAALRLAYASPPARQRARAGLPGQWNRAPAAPDRLDPLPDPADAPSRRDAFVYAWDAEAARRDPASVLAEFEAFVRETTDEVVARLRRSAGDVGPAPGRGVGTPAPRPVRTGESPTAEDFAPALPAPEYGRGGEAAVDGAPKPARGFDETALRRLDTRVADMLRAHRSRMADFLAERAAGRPQRPGPGTGPGPGGSLRPLDVDPADVEADLG